MDRWARRGCAIDRPASLPPRLEDLLTSLLFVSLVVIDERAHVELSNEQRFAAALPLSLN